jgi:hypothetical protein
MFKKEAGGPCCRTISLKILGKWFWHFDHTTMVKIHVNNMCSLLQKSRDQGGVDTNTNSKLKWDFWKEKLNIAREG